MRLAAALLLALVALAAHAEDKPKFGPEAVTLIASNDYLRRAPAPDYWLLASFYLPQRTSSDCSAAAATMAVNALRGVPRAAEDALYSEASLVDAVGNDQWRAEIAEDGPGVTFDEFAGYLTESLAKAGIAGSRVTTHRPAASDAGALAALRAALAENEANGADIMLVYFNQGVVTGDWNGPHISAIAAYDAAADRVLIMDVDRDWYVPYWTSTATLLAALLKPAPADQGVLAGQTGGYYVASRD